MSFFAALVKNTVLQLTTFHFLFSLVTKEFILNITFLPLTHLWHLMLWPSQTMRKRTTI